MTTRQLDQVRRKFVTLMREDPPPPIMGLPREPLAPIFDRWVARHFDQDEVAVLFELEHQYGEEALADWFAEVLVEAGRVQPSPQAC
jgi:uncharacterized protein (DUF2236 family)